MLTSEWDTSESRPRKFYRTSRDGVRLARGAAPRRQAIDAALTRLDPDTNPDTNPDAEGQES